MTQERYAKNWWVVQRFGKQGYLLASLVLLLIFLPLLTSPETSRFWVYCLLTLIMISGPLSIATRRVDFYLALILGVMMVSTSWLGTFINHTLLEAIDRGTTIVFFAMLGFLIFRQYLFGNHEVTSETLIAAVNAYLCIGIMYAFAYQYVGEADPSAFAGTFMESGDFEGFVYLSFVTMTTLGYGDIAPKTELSAILTYSQAVVGQLYIALTIARVVGIVVAQETSRSD